MHWSPPGVSSRATAVALGRVAIEAQGESIRADRAGVGEVGWACWSVGTAWSTSQQPGRRLEVKTKQSGDVTVLGEGAVLPQSCIRSDGWHLSTTGAPVAVDDVPAWLVDAVGGRWVR